MCSPPDTLTPSGSGPTTAILISANSTRPSTPAQVKGWTVVEMKTDWNTVFPPEK
jgi:hypothetical protein